MSLKNDSSLLIRKAVSTDIDQIYELAQAEQWHTFSASVLKELLKNSSFLIAEKDSKIVGYVRYLTDGIISLYVCELVVEIKERRKGIARTLISELQFKYPHSRIELISEADSFYKENGFREIGIGFRKHHTH